jgi:GTP cyclohydrolase I
MSKLEEAISVIIQELNLQTENDAIFCQRVAEKMRESFSGHSANFEEIFKNKIPNVKKLNSPIEFKNIKFLSYCKHHMTPILGTVTVSYTPNEWIIGLSRIVECVNAISQRLQLQEEMTVEIAECVNGHLSPNNVSVEITAKHYCMQKSPNDILPEIKTSHEIVNSCSIT